MLSRSREYRRYIWVCPKIIKRHLEINIALLAEGPMRGVSVYKHCPLAEGPMRGVSVYKHGPPDGGPDARRFGL